MKKKMSHYGFSFATLQKVAVKSGATFDGVGDSIAERKFWTACRQSGLFMLTLLVPQYEVKTDRYCYRLDFALTMHKVGVEIDGMAYHSEQSTFINDRRRQRALECDGWRIVRFAAKEVLDDPDRCVREFVTWLSAVALSKFGLD
jgi:very-short-patch-repair endonuclease